MNRSNQKYFYSGDLHVICGEHISTHFIESGDLKDLNELNKKIKRWIENYQLDTLLLKIHDANIEGKVSNSIAAMMTRYAILNSSLNIGFETISDEEFDFICSMVAEYVMYDPEFEDKYDKLDDRSARDEKWASFLLKKIGSQIRFNVPLHNMFGRTYYLYIEMLSSEEMPDYIREIITTDFERIFGTSLKDFINIGFMLCARLIKNKGGMYRSYFEIARENGVPVPNDDVIKKCLEQVTCDTENFINICNDLDSVEEHLRAYKLNPLLKYPLIRPWNSSDQMNPENDKFIAPVPDLLIYRFTTGLFYQIFNKFSTKFSDNFGHLFGSYVGQVLKWCNLGNRIISEADIKNYIKNYTGKVPDWIVLCEEGIVLIECKSTKYTQDAYEHGINANVRGYYDQVQKGISQLNEFEYKVPELTKALGVSYEDMQIQTLIISFEPLWGLEAGPIRNWINRDLSNNECKTDWKILWIWCLEEVQPYISKGASFWSFLVDYDTKTYNRFEEIINTMRSNTGSSYSDGILHKYEMKIFDELTNGGELLDNAE